MALALVADGPCLFLVRVSLFGFDVALALEKQQRRQQRLTFVASLASSAGSFGSLVVFSLISCIVAFFVTEIDQQFFRALMCHLYSTVERPDPYAQPRHHPLVVFLVASSFGWPK